MAITAIIDKEKPTTMHEDRYRETQMSYWPLRHEICKDNRQSVRLNRCLYRPQWMQTAVRLAWR